MKKLFLFGFILAVVAGCNTTPVESSMDVETFAKTLESKSDAILVDVRTPQEHEAGYIPNSINIDFRSENFLDEVNKLDKSKPVFIYCQAGGRSARAFQMMKENGFNELYELNVGYGGWLSSGKQISEPEGNADTPVHEEEDFHSAMKSDRLVLVDFMATWCGPCKRMKPFMEKLHDELKDQVLITEVDVDKQPDLAAKYRIEAMPTLVFFKDGKELDRIVGGQTEEQMRKLIADHLL